MIRLRAIDGRYGTLWLSRGGAAYRGLKWSHFHKDRGDFFFKTLSTLTPYFPPWIFMRFMSAF